MSKIYYFLSKILNEKNQNNKHKKIYCAFKIFQKIGKKRASAFPSLNEKK